MGKVSSDWREEIVRETEHYYQGELQQEERSSWLLGTSSALIAIFVSVVIMCIEDQISINIIFFIFPVIAFFLCAFCSIICIIPFTGIRGIVLFSKERNKIENINIVQFISKEFHIESDWDETELQRRIFFHYRNHYIRNNQKSRLVMLSAIFLLIGLSLSTLMIFDILNFYFLGE